MDKTKSTGRRGTRRLLQSKSKRLNYNVREFENSAKMSLISIEQHQIASCRALANML